MNEVAVQLIDVVINGDARDVLKRLPSDSVDLIITSPPYYKQRDYGIKGIGDEDTVEDYLENLLYVFKECVRIIKPTGSVVFNLGDKYDKGSLLLIPYRFAYEAMRRTGVKLINVVTWEKLNPVPRSDDRKLTPSTEPFFIFVKSDDYYFNASAFENLEVKSGKRLKKEVKRLGERYFELIEKSSLTEEQKKLAKKELVEAIREVKEGKIEGFRMKIKGIHAPAFGGKEGGRSSEVEKKGFTVIKLKGKTVRRDVIEAPVPVVRGNFHPAPFPEEVIEKLLLLLTKEGDIVLDPFLGSGTVGVVAKRLKRYFIGIEINPHYCKLAEKRIKKVEKDLSSSLFSVPTF